MATKLVPIPLSGDRIAWIMAGPTRELPDDRKLIRCAAEIEIERSRVAFDVPTQDFTPFNDDMVRGNLPGIIDALGRGEKLYVGCMGGIGRTGTMLAIIAAQHPDLSGPEAVRYVRAAYIPHACETEDQKEQVARLASVDPVVAALDEQGYYLDPAPIYLPWYRRLWRTLVAG